MVPRWFGSPEGPASFWREIIPSFRGWSRQLSAAPVGSLREPILRRVEWVKQKEAAIIIIIIIIIIISSSSSSSSSSISTIIVDVKRLAFRYT
jgi:hypothetical protein